MKAYVIMPYGGASPELKKECDKIFRFLIRTAVEAYDHSIELIRQDRTGEGGHVLGNVIENLSQGEIVIADLSGQNWNVAYELGIRHSLSKSGTVLLCNNETELPFDIRHLNVVVYPRSAWMDEIDEISDRIVSAIRNAVETKRCDSPVHMTFPALPESLTGMLSNNNDAEQRRIKELTAKNRALEEELERANARLESAGLDSKAGEAKAAGLAQIFAEAVKHRNLISDEAVNHLRNLQSDKKYEEFARFLADVLENGYLDETDCRNVYLICRRLGIPEITKRYIETAVGFYPDSEELQGYLANVYSMDYREKDRALTMVNDMLGVKRVNGRFELTPKIRSERMLSSFFDVYLHLKKYNELIDIGKLLLKAVPSYSSRILRNIFSAALRLQQYDLAYAASCRALKSDPGDDQNHNVLGIYYSTRGDMAKSYDSRENALCLDPDYPDYYYSLASIVCDYLYARTSSGEIEKIDVRDKERYAVPFVIQAFLNDNGTFERAVSFLRNNKLNTWLPVLISVYKQEIDPDRAFANLDMSVVNFCFRKRSILFSMVEQLPDDQGNFFD